MTTTRHFSSLESAMACYARRKYERMTQTELNLLGLVFALAFMFLFAIPAQAQLDIGEIIEGEIIDGMESQFLQNFCAQIFQSPDDCLLPAAPEEISTLSTLTIEMSDGQMHNLRNRLRVLRLGASEFDRRELALNSHDSPIRGLALASYATGKTSTHQSSNFSRLGVFVNGTFGFGEKDTTTREDGFDLESARITGGVDYRFTDNFILGLAMGYATMDADLEEKDDEVEVDGYSASLYSTYYLKDFYIDFIASVGLNDYEITRNIRFERNALDDVDKTAIGDTEDDVDKTAIGDTDGVQYTLGLGVGYEFRIARATLGPYLQINYLKADIDGFREQGADDFNLKISDQDFESLISVVGGQASYTIRAGFGDLIPQARFEWWHEFENDSRSIDENEFANFESPKFSILTDDPDRDYFILGLGTLVVFSENATLFLEYQTTLGLEDVTHHIARAQLALNF